MAKMGETKLEKWYRISYKHSCKLKDQKLIDTYPKFLLHKKRYIRNDISR